MCHSNSARCLLSYHLGVYVSSALNGFLLYPFIVCVHLENPYPFFKSQLKG